MDGATLPSMFPSVSSRLMWIHVSVPQFQSQSNPTAPVLWVGAGWTGTWCLWAGAALGNDTELTGTNEERGLLLISAGVGKDQC